MRKRILIAIAIIALAAIISRIYSYAHSGGWRHWHNREGWYGRNWQSQNRRPIPENLVEQLDRRLDLTDEQRTQLDQIVTEARPTIDSLTNKLRQASEQLRDVDADGQLDEGKVIQLATDQAQALAELTVVKVRRKSKVLAVLTPDQRNRARGLLEGFAFGLATPLNVRADQQ